MKSPKKTTTTKSRLAGETIYVQCDADIVGGKMLDHYTSPITPTVVSRLLNAGAHIKYVTLKEINTDKPRFAIVFAKAGYVPTDSNTNGRYGMQPSYGAVSRYGFPAVASSMDVAGCIASSPSDIALIMSVIGGKDDNDSTSFGEVFDAPDAKAQLKIGIIKGFSNKSVVDYTKKLSKLGHEISEVSMPILEFALPVYTVIKSAETASNFYRYDGMRYGYRLPDAHTLDDIYSGSRGEGLSDPVKHHILLGTYLLSAGQVDKYFFQAQKVRTLIINAFNDAFDKYDILVCPLSASTASASLAGLPWLATPENVLLIGSRKSDARLLALAAEIES